MRYWVLTGQGRQGPLEPRDLRAVPGFGPDSLVCPEGLAPAGWKNWGPARGRPDLAETLAPAPAAEPAGPVRYWALTLNGRQGPYEAKDLPKVAGLTLENLLCPERLPFENWRNWRPARAFPEAAAALAASAPAPGEAAAPAPPAAKGLEGMTWRPAPKPAEIKAPWARMAAKALNLASPQPAGPRFDAPIPDQQAAFLAEQLATVLEGGIPLVTALRLASINAPSPNIKQVVAGVESEVATGKPLFRALEARPLAFDPLVTSLVEAGEASGQLPLVLRRSAAYLAARAELRAKILSALTYPFLLLLVAALVVIAFIVKVVPIFSSLFAAFELQLPVSTRLVLWISDAAVHRMPALVLAAAAAALAARRILATTRGQALKWRLLLAAPVAGSFLRCVLLERLLGVLAALLRGGVSFMHALSLIERMFRVNPHYAARLEHARRALAAGLSPSTSFRQTLLFPPLVLEMFEVGETSGTLPDMIDSCAAFYRGEVERATQRFTAVLEPLMIAGIGAVIGSIVMAVFMPVFKLATMTR